MAIPIVWYGNVLSLIDLVPPASFKTLKASSAPFVVRNKSSIYLVAVLPHGADGGLLVHFLRLAFIPQFQSSYVLEEHALRSALPPRSDIDYWDYGQDLSGFETLFARHKDEFAGQPRRENEIQTLFFPLRNGAGRIIATVTVSSPSLKARLTEVGEALRLVILLLLGAGGILGLISLWTSPAFLRERRLLPGALIVLVSVGLRIVASPLSPARAGPVLGRLLAVCRRLPLAGRPDAIPGRHPVHRAPRLLVRGVPGRLREAAPPAARANGGAGPRPRPPGPGRGRRRRRPPRFPARPRTPRLQLQPLARQVDDPGAVHRPPARHPPRPGGLSARRVPGPQGGCPAGPGALGVGPPGCRRGRRPPRRRRARGPAPPACRSPGACLVALRPGRPPRLRPEAGSRRARTRPGRPVDVHRPGRPDRAADEDAHGNDPPAGHPRPGGLGQFPHGAVFRRPRPKRPVGRGLFQEPRRPGLRPRPVAEDPGRQVQLVFEPRPPGRRGQQPQLVLPERAEILRPAAPARALGDVDRRPPVPELHRQGQGLPHRLQGLERRDALPRAAHPLRLARPGDAARSSTPRTPTSSSSGPTPCPR